jgi:hypothetical protein
MEGTDLKLDDSVLARIVQIIQEGLLLGEDITDSMRLIRLSAVDGNLVMTPAYKDYVASLHDKLLDNAKKLKDQQQEGVNKLIFDN